MAKKYSESTIGALMEKHNDELASIKEYLEDVPKIKEKTQDIEKKLEKIEDDIEIFKLSLKGRAKTEEVQKLEKRVVVLEAKLKSA